MIIRPAAAADLESGRRLLAGYGLPTSDVGECLDGLFVAEDDDSLVGIGGLEVHGDHGLVRSLAVDADRRGAGVGRLLYQAVEQRARELALRDLFLLTETAETFFAGQDFVRTARSSAPPEIRASREFAELCPASAVLMIKPLA